MSGAAAAAEEAAGDVPPAQELRTHVTVAVRVKGLDAHGADADDLPAIFPTEADPDRSLVIDGPSRGATAFTFDRCFWSLGESKRCVCLFVCVGMTWGAVRTRHVKWCLPLTPRG
jgi:hypothetical protein